MRNDGEKRTEMERLPPIARAHLQRPPNSDHLDADLLTAFAEQSLPPRERQQVLEHLSRCAQCREVAVLAGAEPEDADDALREREFELVAAASAAPATASPSLSPQLSPARAAAPSPAQNRWLGHPPARWIALAACVVLCATVAIRYPTLWRGKPLASPASKIVDSDQIADNRPSGTASDSVEPAVPAPPPAQQKAAGAANPASAPIPRSPASVQGRNIKPLAPAASLSAPRARSYGNPSLADKSPNAATVLTAPQAQLTPQAAAPVRAANTLRSPTGTAHGAAGGVIGGIVGGAAIGAGTASALAPRAPRAATQTVTVAKLIQPQWSLSEDGTPQRSDDSGHSWQKVPVGANVQFRALYADQLEIWVGGAAGILYHSSDMGANWMSVHPTDGDAKLSADVARIDFKDRLHGDVTTTKGEIWTTLDGGVSWVRH
jgi:hypothetical protein